MLLIGGVKYELWTPSSEDEFERVVKEHTQDIFGEQSIYLDIKQKLKSELGTGSIPDGFIIFFGDSPHWRIVEVELSWHPLHDHIVSQVGRFISGIDNTSTQKKIVDATYDEIAEEDLTKLRKAIEPVETYRFLADLVSKPPILTIIIEKDTPGLREALRILRYPQIKVVEFQTFTREGVGLAVHAHLFEPLYKPTIPAEPQPPVSLPPPGDSVEITLKPWQMKYPFISIPARKDLFPDSETKLTLETDIGVIEANFIPKYHRVALSKWFKAHPELKAGDKLLITVIQLMKKYRLELLK